MPTDATDTEFLSLYENAIIVIDFLSRSQVTAVGMVLAFLLAIALWFFPRQPGPQLASHYRLNRVLGAKGRRLPGDVEILYRGAKIENLCRTLFMVWNYGARIVRGQNIVGDDPVRIDLGEGAVVLDAQILKATREVTKCAVSGAINSKQEVPFTFEFLDPKDGFIVEIFHTDSGKPPELRGTIEEMPRGFKAFGRRYPVKLHILTVQFALATGGALTILWLFANVWNSEVWTAKNITAGLFFLFFAALFVILGGYGSFYGWRRYPKALVMPDFQQ